MKQSTSIPVPQPDSAQVTRLLLRWRDGDERAFDALIPLVYDQLRAIARRRLQSERPCHTLQPTALVHEAYVRMTVRDRPPWRSRAHFFAVAALVMRRVLIDHARRYRRQRRGDSAVKVELDESLLPNAQLPPDLVTLEESLQQLEAQDPRKARVVQLRFFGGLTLDEVADVLQVAQVTVVRDWRLARAWLLRELTTRGSG